MLEKISEKAKAMGTVIASTFGIIATIGGGVLYVENTYANAGDVRSIIKNQNIQIKQNLMFQLEYYDDKIKKLEIEKSRSEEILQDPSTSRSYRAYTRKPEAIQEEIQEIKIRRDIVRRDLINLPILNKSDR